MKVQGSTPVAPTALLPRDQWIHVFTFLVHEVALVRIRLVCKDFASWFHAPRLKVQRNLFYASRVQVIVGTSSLFPISHFETLAESYLKAGFVQVAKQLPNASVSLDLYRLQMNREELASTERLIAEYPLHQNVIARSLMDGLIQRKKHDQALQILQKLKGEMDEQLIATICKLCEEVDYHQFVKWFGNISLFSHHHRSKILLALATAQAKRGEMDLAHECLMKMEKLLLSGDECYADFATGQMIIVKEKDAKKIAIEGDIVRLVEHLKSRPIRLFLSQSTSYIAFAKYLHRIQHRSTAVEIAKHLLAEYKGEREVLTDEGVKPREFSFNRLELPLLLEILELLEQIGERELFELEYLTLRKHSLFIFDYIALSHFEYKMGSSYFASSYHHVTGLIDLLEFVTFLSLTQMNRYWDLIKEVKDEKRIDQFAKKLLKEVKEWRRVREVAVKEKDCIEAIHALEQLALRVGGDSIGKRVFAEHKERALEEQLTKPIPKGEYLFESYIQAVFDE